MSEFYPYIQSRSLTNVGSLTFTIDPLGEPYEYGTLPFLDESGSTIEAPQAKFFALAMVCSMQAVRPYSGTLKMTGRKDGIELFHFIADFNIDFSADFFREATTDEVSIIYPVVAVKAGYRNPVTAGGYVYDDTPPLVEQFGGELIPDPNPIPKYGGTYSINNFSDGLLVACASTQWFDLPLESGMEFVCEATGFDDFPFVYDGFTSHLNFYVISAFNPVPAFYQLPFSGPSDNSIRPQLYLPGYTYAPSFTPNVGFDSSNFPPITELGIYAPDGPNWVKSTLPLPIIPDMDYPVDVEDGPNELWLYARDGNGCIGWQKLVVQGTGIDTISAVTLPDGSKLIADGNGYLTYISRLEPYATEATPITTNIALPPRPRLSRHLDGLIVCVGRDPYPPHNVMRYTSRDEGKTWS